MVVNRWCKEREATDEMINSPSSRDIDANKTVSGHNGKLPGQVVSDRLTELMTLALQAARGVMRIPGQQTCACRFHALQGGEPEEGS